MYKLSDIFNTNSLLDALEIPDAYNGTLRFTINGLVWEVEQLDSSVSNEYLVDIVAYEEAVYLADVVCFKLSLLSAQKFECDLILYGDKQLQDIRLYSTNVNVMSDIVNLGLEVCCEPTSFIQLMECQPCHGVPQHSTG